MMTPPTLPRDITISLSHHQPTQPTNPQMAWTQTQNPTNLNKPRSKSVNLLVLTHSPPQGLSLPSLQTRTMTRGTRPRTKMKMKNWLKEAASLKRLSVLKDNLRCLILNWWTMAPTWRWISFPLPQLPSPLPHLSWPATLSLNLPLLPPLHPAHDHLHLPWLRLKRSNAVSLQGRMLPMPVPPEDTNAAADEEGDAELKEVDLQPAHHTEALDVLSSNLLYYRRNYM